MAKRIVIVGGGFGGILAANTLARELSDQIGEEHIKLILISEHLHHHQCTSLHYLALELVDVGELSRPIHELLRPEVSLVVSRAVRISVRDHRVVLSDGRSVEYDYLIIATGADVAPDETPGLVNVGHWYYTLDGALRLRHELRRFKRGRIAHVVASYPLKCPTAPINFTLMLAKMLHERRRGELVEITFTYPLKAPAGVEELAKYVIESFEELKVQFVPMFLLDRVDVERREAVGIDGEKIKFDLLIAVPHHVGSKLVARSGLGDPMGWAGVDRRRLNVRKLDNVFAIGDVIGLPVAKNCASVVEQIRVVAHNILSDMLGACEKIDYEGNTFTCITTTRGYVCVEFSFKRRPAIVQDVVRPEYYAFAVPSSMYWSILRRGVDLRLSRP